MTRIVAPGNLVRQTRSASTNSLAARAPWTGLHCRPNGKGICMPNTNRWQYLAAIMLSALFGTGEVTAEKSAEARLAPNGTIRAALILANPVLVTRTPEGELTGVSVDLANALGTKLGFPVRFVPYENIVRFNQSIGKDEWDVAFAPARLVPRWPIGLY